MPDQLDPMQDDQDDEEEKRLDLVARFTRGAASARFMTRLGRPFAAGERRLAEAYLSALGFPHAEIAPLADFEEAAQAAETLDSDSAAWEASEQLRAALTQRAAALLGEEKLEQALREVLALLAIPVEDAVRDAAAGFDVVDEALINAAVGALLRACHNAALVLLAGESEDHGLALEYALFETGRWPVALTGETLHIF